MNSMTDLALGYSPYLNCVPYYYYLRQCGFRGRYVSGVPSALNQMLRSGDLDASPSSSFEYAQNWRDYMLLPNLSISAIGKVTSVLLFSPVSLPELSGSNIAITGESATSINLLRIILREFYGLHDVTDTVPVEPVENLISQGSPALLIGDRALSLAAKQPDGMHVFDLGDIWYAHTGLPFVFALWMVARSALVHSSTELNALGEQLNQSHAMLKSAPVPIAKAIAEQTEHEVDAILAYWNTINYELGKAHLSGLQLFYQLCHKHSLLTEIPELHFV